MCATALRAGSRSFRAGSRMTSLIFPIRVVGPSEMGLLPVQVSNLVMAAVMASLLLSFWSQVVSFDPCPFGFDESDGCSFGSSRRKSAGSFSASACPGRLLSSNCGGLLGAGSWSRRSGRPSADSGASKLLFFFLNSSRRRLLRRWREFSPCEERGLDVDACTTTGDLFQRILRTVPYLVLVSRQSGTPRPSARLKAAAIARMQNKLCDVTKCLTTVAAGVLSCRDRKKKLETGLLFEVLLLDQQISFGVRLFFVTRCPHVPLVTCQKAQTWKKCANGASFRVKMYSSSSFIFVELMGEEDAKTPVLYVGNCLFTGS